MRTNFLRPVGIAIFGLALVACGSSAAPSAIPSPTVSPTASLAAGSTATTAEPARSTSPSLPPTASVSQEAEARSATPSVTPTPVAKTPHTTRPAVRPTKHAAPHTKAAPAPTHRAAPRTKAPTPVHSTAKAKSGLCSIRSNAGNCYAAGQFCRNADVGRTTTNADGRSITCRVVSGKPHWQY